MSTQALVEIPRNVPTVTGTESSRLQIVPPKTRESTEQSAASGVFGVPTSDAKANDPVKRPAVTENESILVEFTQEFELQAKKVIFNVSLDTGDLMIQVVDGETGDIVRQIPPEEVIAFARRFREVLGLLLDEKV